MDNHAFQLDDQLEADANGTKIGKLNQPANKQDAKSNRGFLYTIEEVPPWHQCILLSLQQFMTMAVSTITTPYIIGPALCIPVQGPGAANILSTIFFTSALTTLLQTTFGVRLPIIQGSSASFYAPLFVIMNLPEWKCPNTNHTMSGNATEYTYTEADDEVWHVRLRELKSMNTILASQMTSVTFVSYSEYKTDVTFIQGAILLASVVPVILSITGVITILIKYITPLVVTPTVALIGLSLVETSSDMASTNWTVAIITILLLIIFNQYLGNVPLPYPSHEAGCQFKIKWFYWFKYFPIVTVLAIMWLTCHILTVTDVIPLGDAARTDLKTHILPHVKWFRIPYPGQWGWPPTFSAASVLGMLSGTIATIIESIGDYYSCARLSGAPPPPPHAISRGIFMEGIGCICAALWGTGTGTTSYSDNIGAISITKVSSRRVFQCATVFMIIVAVVTRIGAILITVPQPIVGGLMMFLFSMITAIGISNIQFVNLNSSRNLFVVGFSLFVGISLPKWLSKHPGIIKTGVPTVDEVIFVLLSTSMLVGGVIGFLLDNTVPGTDEERGIVEFNKQLVDSDGSSDKDMSVYDFPIGMKWIRQIKCFRKIPFCPTFVSPKWMQRAHERRQENHSLNGVASVEHYSTHNSNF